MTAFFTSIRSAIFAALASIFVVGAAEPLSFGDDIRPILNRNCTGCHGGVKMAGDVSFIYRHLALGKGESGKQIIIPGDAEGSEMIRRVVTTVVDDLMPPAAHGKPLSQSEIDLLKQWINEGAEWEEHWAFVAPVEQELPEAADVWSSQPIDRLVLEKMKEHGLEPNSEASPEQLLRRLKFDLLGLPPSIKELDPFESAYAEDSHKAWLEAINTYLNDSAYGERWASVWMDLARYADSEGLGHDRKRDVWPYRDWLIQAYNEDMPFDQFTVKQLAGDLLESPSIEDHIATVFHRLTQANEEGGTDDEEFRITAVMDRVNTTWEVWQGQTFGCTQCHSHPYDTFEHEEYFSFAAFFNNSQDADLSNHAPLLRVPNDRSGYDEATELYDELVVANTRFYQPGRALAAATPWQAATIQSLSVNKGQVHVVDIEGEQEIQTKGTVASQTHFKLLLNSPAELSALKIEILPEDGDDAASIPNLGSVLSYIEVTELGADGQRSARKIVYPVSDLDDTGFLIEDSLNAKSHHGWGPYSKISHPRWAVLPLEAAEKVGGGNQLELRLEFNLRYQGIFPQVAKRMRVSVTDSSEWRDWVQSQAVSEQYAALSQVRQSYRKIKGPAIPVMRERVAELSRRGHLFERGNWLEKGKVIERAATPQSFPAMQGKPESPNRLDMAKWLVSDKNPLSSRVVVNRLWHQLFGRGIVETLEDFGSSGEKPSNQALLDYLARRYQFQYAWSQKAILREILSSKVYRQASSVTAEKRLKDPRNVWMSYGSRRRLRAEAIRDSSLFVSGLLHQQLYGAPVYPPFPKGVWKPFRSSDKWRTPPVGDPQRYRRALYTYWKRSLPYPALMSFDTPTREICSKRRLVSNTPIAALTSMNDEAFAECAQGLARVMKYQSAGTVGDRLALAYRAATSQRVTPTVLEDLIAAFHDMEQHYREKPELMRDIAGTPDGAAYTVMASLILNLDASLTK